MPRLTMIGRMSSLSYKVAFHVCEVGLVSAIRQSSAWEDIACSIHLVLDSQNFVALQLIWATS